MGGLAYVVSQVASPPVCGLALVLLAADASAAPGAFRWAMLYAVTAILLPVAYLFLLKHRGEIGDVDVRGRRERLKPMWLSAMTTGLVWGVFSLGNAPHLLITAAGSLAVGVWLLLLITLRWKISLHCALVALLGTSIWVLWTSALPLILLGPAMMGSRIRLRRHTFAQTAAGLALGIVVGRVFFA
jgi:membrane-associated phospholipid phosphatase